MAALALANAEISVASASSAICDGKLETKMIDFETKLNDEHLSRGEVPFKLADGVYISCERAKNSPNPATVNDCAVFDTQRPKKEKSLESETEGNIIIINREPTYERLRPNP